MTALNRFITNLPLLQAVGLVFELAEDYLLLELQGQFTASQD